MNCIEYYKDKCGIDISVLPREERNYIATCYLESIYFTKEELEEIIKKYSETSKKSEKVEGGTYLNSQK